MRIAYFDCFAGVSGDMILGALVDAGLSLDLLSSELVKLPLKGYRLTAERTRRQGLAGTKADVIIEETGTKPPRRSLNEILALIDQGTLHPIVKERSSRIFQRLAEAEAKVHGIPVEEVHFHEVGAVDAIVDIVGAVAGSHLLGVQEFYASALPVGKGMVASKHGKLPLPAPATLELVAMSKAPLRPSFDAEEPWAEMVTPTGAAIVTTLASFQRPAMNIQRIGCGAGSRDFVGFPNLLRLWIGEKSPEAQAELALLETNIDDMSPELGGYVMERLFKEGAYDVWFTPIQMKKNRPAFMLSVLAPAELEEPISEIILRETSTLGVRVQRIRRHESERKIVEFESSLGPVRVKLKERNGAILGIAPEFEDCRRLAIERNLPLQQVYRTVTTEAESYLKTHNKRG